MISVSDMGNVDVQNKLRIEVEFFPSKERRRVELDGNATGIELLRALNKHLDSHLLTRNGTPMPVDERLRDKDEIRIISVASGG
jgi:sulfur carrier protein ThiS